VIAVSETGKYPERRVRSVFGAANAEITIVRLRFRHQDIDHGQEPQRFREADLSPSDSAGFNNLPWPLSRAPGPVFRQGSTEAHVVRTGRRGGIRVGARGKTVDLALW